MKITFAGWLSVIVSVCLGLTDASPTNRVASQESTDSYTGSPLLLTLTLPEDHVSLVPEKSPRDESSRATTSSYETGTSQETNSPHSRGVRSATSKENQAPVETTVVRTTEEVTAGSTKEETTVVPVDGATTTGLVTEETTGSFATEKTSAPVEVILNQYFLENASKIVLLVLAKIEDQRRELNIPNYNVDELARPMLPANIRENAEQCVQIQPMQRAMQKVLTDFKPYLGGLNGDTSTHLIYAVRSLELHITYMTSPPSDDTYIPATTPETNVKNSEEVLCTLMTLQTQCEIIRQVLSDLKNC